MSFFRFSYYPNVSEQNYIKSPEFEAECNDMINIHPYMDHSSTEELEKLPEPQALSSSSLSFFSTQYASISSSDDVKTR